MDRILVPTDFSKDADNALEFALAMAREKGAKVILFSSVFIPSKPGGMLVSIKDRLKEDTKEGMELLKSKLLKRFQEASEPAVELETSVTFGHPVKEIVAEANALNVDLIVMGTRGSSGLEEVLIGSTTSRVMLRASCPVMAIPFEARYHTIQRIVFATDLNLPTQASMDKLRKVADLCGALVDVVHVEESQQPSGRDYSTEKADIEAKLSYDHLEFNFLNHFDVVDGLTDYLTNSKADMLCMITRKRNWLQKFFDPSLTKHIALHTNLPLLTLHEA